jgi:hypothetical protein
LYPNTIYIPCKRSSTFDHLLLAAFDALGPVYEKYRTDTKGNVPQGVALEFLGLRLELLGGKQRASSVNVERALAPQLTSYTLAKYCALAEAPLIVDDAHKLADSEFERLAEAMREWQTLALSSAYAKMVVIGSDTGTSRLATRLVRAAPDLNQRLAAFRLELMTKGELAAILTTAASALNVNFSGVADQIVSYSSGFPGVCQDLALQTCVAAGVVRTQELRIDIMTESLDRGLMEFVRTSTETVRIAFEQFDQMGVEGLPGGFVPAVLDEVEQKVSTSLGISIDEARRGLARLAADEDGILRIVVGSGEVHFQEPIYLVFYRLKRASANNEVNREALLRRFQEIFEAPGKGE